MSLILLIPCRFHVVNLYPSGINMRTIINILRCNIKIGVKYICNGVGGYDVPCGEMSGELNQHFLLLHRDAGSETALSTHW
jgi:hypothetical protein